MAKLHDLGREPVGGAEVVAPREINQLLSQPHLTSFEETDIVDFVQQVTRLAAFHNPILVRVAFENVTQAVLIDSNATVFRRAFEDLRECSRCWWLDPRAITHASQERLVNEISLVEVRRENDELFERHFDLLTAVQRQEVNTSLERQNPAVQQVSRRYALPAEVVDDQCATIRLNLKRRFVELCGFGKREIRVVERQLATDDDQWSLNLDPTAIMFDDRRSLRHRTMAVRVEDTNDVVIDFNRVGDPDGAEERLVHAF